MNLTREKARDRKPDIKENLKNTFGSRAEKLTDAIISDGHMLGVCGLSFYAPICMMLENDELISQYLLGLQAKTIFLFLTATSLCTSRRTVKLSCRMKFPKDLRKYAVLRKTQEEFSAKRASI